MSNTLIKCTCGCGESFKKYDKRGRERKFIHNHHARLQPKLGKDVTCENCGKVFYKPRWHLKRVAHHFCNQKCEGEWSTKHSRRSGKNNGHYNTITVNCTGGCGNTVSKAESLISRRNGKVYCPDCVHLTRQGKRGFYIGYPPEFNNTLRRKIRIRDNYTCQECGKQQKRVGYTLHIHHIDYDKNNSSPINLISLCRSCHGSTNFGHSAWQEKYTSLMKSR